jgi:hypothetical protein
VTSQAAHCAVQAVSQQKPSTQWFDVHSLSAPQDAPSSLRWQAPLTHAPPGAQSDAAVHDVLQARLVASHRYGEQLVFVGVHSPAALHVAASDSVTASEQIGSAHDFPALGT